MNTMMNILAFKSLESVQLLYQLDNSCAANPHKATKINHL